MNDAEYYRDYLAEAYAIIRGTTMLLPEREHLVALLKASQRQSLAATSAGGSSNGHHKEVP